LYPFAQDLFVSRGLVSVPSPLRQYACCWPSCLMECQHACRLRVSIAVLTITIYVDTSFMVMGVLGRMKGRPKNGDGQADVRLPRGKF